MPIFEPVYRQYFKRPIAYGQFFGRYETFADAAAAVPGTLPATYDTAESAGMYGDRLDRLHPEDYPVLFWLRTLLRPGLRIFDLGGHVGIARHAFGRVLPLDDVDWLVQDLPAVAERGRALATERPAPGLHFTSQFADGDGTDVWLAFGSIQYLEQRLPDILGDLVRPPAAILLNKTPIHPHVDAVTLQNTGVAICPYRIFADLPLVAALRAVGYTAVERWKNPGSRCKVPFHREIDVDPYSGMLLRRL